MKHTLKVYKDSADHATYLNARFDKQKTGNSFSWAGHRWAYECTSFDDAGDYDLLYRFDDQLYPEDMDVTTDDMTIRDYFAAKAMHGYISTAAAPCIIGGLDGAEDELAKQAYKMADAMLRAREVS
ncbi:hypothetical protein ACQVA2_12335 [Citrobacter sp. OP27]